MSPSYTVLASLARVLATHARPQEQLLNDAAAIIGASVGGMCLIGVGASGSSVFGPVGVYHDEHEQQALINNTPGFVWPVSRRAEQVLSTGAPYLGLAPTSISQRPTAESSAPWRDALQETGPLPHMMVAIRFAGVSVGMLVIARKQPMHVYTVADFERLEGAIDILALALRTFSVHPADPSTADGPPQVTRSGVAKLNEREREVIALLAQGLTTAEIADTMYLSARTIEWYRARILRKLGRPTRADLVALGRSFGEIEK